MITTCVETITPDVAKKYLQHNRKNRKVKPRQVESLARDIRQGNFKLTHQGIAFNSDGQLVDGQHRLLATLLAQLPITIMVSRDMPADCVEAIDRGETRSVCDIMNIEHSDERMALKDAKIVSALSQMVRCYYGRFKLSTAQTIALYKTMSKAVDAVYDIISRSTAYRRMTAPMIAAIIAAIHKGVPATQAEKFCGVLCKADISGCENYNCQAPLNWQRQIDSAKARHIIIDREKMFLCTENAIWHFVNNTSATRIYAPDAPRYDVADELKTVIGTCNENQV